MQEEPNGSRLGIVIRSQSPLQGDDGLNKKQAGERPLGCAGRKTEQKDTLTANPKFSNLDGINRKWGVRKGKRCER